MVRKARKRRNQRARKGKSWYERWEQATTWDDSTISLVTTRRSNIFTKITLACRVHRGWVKAPGKLWSTWCCIGGECVEESTQDVHPTISNRGTCRTCFFFTRCCSQGLELSSPLAADRKNCRTLTIHPRCWGSIYNCRSKQVPHSHIINCFVSDFWFVKRSLGIGARHGGAI